MARINDLGEIIVDLAVNCGNGIALEIFDIPIQPRGCPASHEACGGDSLTIEVCQSTTIDFNGITLFLGSINR